MQEVPLDPEVMGDRPRLRRSVEGVTQHRVANHGKVDPNLVRAAGLDRHVEQGCTLESMAHGEMADRILSRPYRCHPQSVRGIPADRSVDRGLFFIKDARHQGQV